WLRGSGVPTTRVYVIAVRGARRSARRSRADPPRPHRARRSRAGQAALAADDGAGLCLVLAEFVEAERRAGGGDERERRHVAQALWPSASPSRCRPQPRGFRAPAGGLRDPPTRDAAAPS